MLEGILLPIRRIGNQKRIQGQFRICSGSEDIDKRMTELCICPQTPRPEKKRPLGGKYLVWMAELIGANALLPQNVSCCEMNCELLYPSKNLPCEIAYYSRDRVPLFLDVCHHGGTVAHLAQGLPHYLIPESDHG